MTHLTLDYPTDLADSIRLTPAELSATVRLMAALKMFELGKLTAGQAAGLAQMSRTAFLDACGAYNVSPFNYPDGEAADQITDDINVATRARA
ncbi:MAG: UPF0175 family protein [Armatimonadetes bacterium]|nr:UPF0175 family protein [Armatimonadota bacterium]